MKSKIFSPQKSSSKLIKTVLSLFLGGVLSGGPSVEVKAQTAGNLTATMISAPGLGIIPGGSTLYTLEAVITKPTAGSIISLIMTGGDTLSNGSPYGINIPITANNNTADTIEIGYVGANGYQVYGGQWFLEADFIDSLGIQTSVYVTVGDGIYCSPAGLEVVSTGYCNEPDITATIYQTSINPPPGPIRINSTTPGWQVASDTSYANGYSRVSQMRRLGTAVPAPPLVFQVTNTSSGECGDTVVVNPQCGLPLPIEFTSFTIDADCEEARLRWKSTLPNQTYTVQRRKKGESDWKDIGTTQDFGTKLEGEYTDTTVESNTTYEYRLVDSSNLTSTSHTLVVNTDDCLRNPTAYPNPTANTMHIRGLIGNYTYTISDLHGREVITPQKAMGNTEVDLRNLAAGMYIIKIILENGSPYTLQIRKSAE